MRLPKALTAAAGLLTLITLLIIGYLVTLPRGEVITHAEVGLTSISPNADGDSDITTISYRIRRKSELSIYFEDESGQRFYYRESETRTKGRYSVRFSGIVDGFTLEGEDVKGEILARLLPDGEYTWVIEAVDSSTGQIDQKTGTLLIEGGDPDLPDIWEFSVSPEIFTPNQDGLDDRVWINVYLPKDATLSVVLIDERGQRVYIPEFQEARSPGEEGRHSFEYDGGIDNGTDPPPDGTYTVLVEAVDDEGQHVRRTGQMTVKDGGVPLAEIVAQPTGDTLRFSSEIVNIGDILSFEITVYNYGDAPIRTTGPFPGHVYEQSELYTSTGYYQESGAWRIGLNCDTCLTDYPWRWALGSPDELTPIETDGVTHYYLMPGERIVVSGGIRLIDIVESRNPQQFWAGLIHEDVGIAPLNNRVDPHWIEIILTSALTPDN